MPPAEDAPRHIVIAGLMGAGKTSVGRRLGEKLGLPWRDSDIEIEVATGQTVRELRDRDGVDAMHAREHRTLLDALAAPEANVISAAASVMDDATCRSAMAQPDVTVIWLRARPAVLGDRFASKDDNRPAYGEIPADFLAAQAARREPLLESIGATVVDTDDLTIDEVVERALSLLR